MMDFLLPDLRDEGWREGDGREKGRE